MRQSMADTARVLFHPVNKVVTVPNNSTVLEAHTAGPDTL